MKKLILIMLFVCQIHGEDGHWFREKNFQKLLDEQTHSVARSGNQIKLLINGAHAFEQRIKNIQNADVIFIKTFEFWNDKSGSAILKLLTKKARNGAKVFIQFDVKGTTGPIASTSMNDIKQGRSSPIPDYLQKFVEESRGNGFVIPTNMPNSLINSNIYVLKDHEKTFITWEYKNRPASVKVIMGGMNTGDMYLLGGEKNSKGGCETVDFYQSEGFSGPDVLPMRDTDVEIIGSVTQDVLRRFILAAEFQLNNPSDIFKRDFMPHIKEAILEMKLIEKNMHYNSAIAFPTDIGSAFLRFIYKNTNQYGSKDVLNVHNFFQLALQSVPSRTTVQIAAGFFMPTKSLWKSISDASRRSVNFDILLNNLQGAESTIVGMRRLTQSQILHVLKVMPAGSIDFYEWIGAASECIGTSTHQKIYSFGIGENAPCCIGSANLDALSFVWDSEDLLVIQDPEFKKQFDLMLKKDFASPYSQKITITELENRSFLEKVQEYLANKFLRNFL